MSEEEAFEQEADEFAHNCLEGVAKGFDTVDELRQQRAEHALTLAQHGSSNYRSPVLEGFDRAIAQLAQACETCKKGYTHERV